MPLSMPQVRLYGLSSVTICIDVRVSNLTVGKHKVCLPGDSLTHCIEKK